MTTITPHPQPSTHAADPRGGVPRVPGCGRAVVARAGTGQRPAGGVAGFGTTHGVHHSPSPTVAAWGGFAATCPVTGDTVAGRRARQGRPASRSSSYTHHTQPPAPAVGGAAAGGQTSPFLPVPGRVAVTGGPASGAPTVYGDTLCTTLSNAVPLSLSPLQCRGNRPNGIDHTPRGGGMPAIPAISLTLRELAEDVRALAQQVADEAVCETMAVRDLRAASQRLLNSFVAVDDLRLHATHILERGDLSEWRLRSPVREVDPQSVCVVRLREQCRAVRRAAIAVMRDDDQITVTRQRLLAAVDALESEIAQLDPLRWTDLVRLCSEVVRAWFSWEALAAEPVGVG